MRVAIFIIFFFTYPDTFSQVPEEPATTTEQQLENITENNEDTETEDDSFLQQMVRYQRSPLNLNEAGEDELAEFRIFSPVQIQHFLSYRSVLGNFLSVYELQAIPGWNIETIRKILPYVMVSSRLSVKEDFISRFRGGDHSLLLRATQVLEKSKGYLKDSTPASNYYPGSPQRLMLRYKYTYKNLLQYGLVAEKDPGEEFFRGTQKQGFDYYSAHLFARNIGVMKALALGDFTVNLGQGLTQWQSMAFKKGPDVLATKRQAATLRPYNSAGEIYFHRGAGLTLGKDTRIGSFEATLFGSLRNIDGNYVSDTSLYAEDFITSFQVSGYHRTKPEVADKGIQRQTAFGGNLSYRKHALKIGINSVSFRFKYPVKKGEQLYNRFALSGKSLSNHSVDFGYTYRNLHFFGEAATSSMGGKAFVNGLLISTSVNVDMSFMYRNIDPRYQSLNTNAFSESTLPNNERGFFAGISIRPGSGFRIDAYADIYRFPYLRFRVNNPSEGSDFFIQLHYKPDKQLEMYSRYKRESKGINFNPDQLVISPVIHQPRQNWRSHLNYKVNNSVTVRSRTEIVWFNRKASSAEEGYLIYGDVIYRPPLKPWSLNGRLLYFETDGYNSRLYTYENDVLYSFSIPVFSGQGFRWYFNASYDITRKLTGWLKVAQTVYTDRDKVGSGLDEISGNRKTEVKMQVLYRF